MTKDTTITASFELKKFDFTVSSGENGTVDKLGTSPQDCGMTITLLATPNENYKFLNWTNNIGHTELTENPLTITIVSNVELRANFGRIDAIEEVIKSGIVSISPNPTNKDFTISFDILKPNNMKIILTNLSGKEILEIYNAFVLDGFFSKKVSTTNLVKGVYFLNILIDGNFAVEKVIIE
jgi:hypothetical protein